MRIQNKLPLKLPPLPAPHRPWQVDVAAILAAATIAALAYLLIVYPAQHERRQIEQLAADRKAQQEQQRTLEGNVRSAAAQLKEIRHFISQAQVRLEPESRLSTRIGALSELATRAGLAVDGIEPGARIVSNTPAFLSHTVPIRLVGRGPYDRITAFLRSLHQNMRDAPVTSLDLSAVPTTTTGPTVAFTIELQWHTAAPPPAPPSSPQTAQLNNGN